MQGHIDTSFQTLQRDLFASGVAAKIGMNAFGVWLAIKSHADYNTGQAWPGMRRLAELTGLSLGAVSNGVHALVDARLLRVVEVAKGKSRRGNTYIARERLDVRIGDFVVCTIVLDYVPATLRSRLKDIDMSLKTGKAVGEGFARCDVFMGDAFVWDEDGKCWRANIPAGQVPLPDLSEEQLKAPVVQRLLALQKKAKGVRRG